MNTTILSQLTIILSDTELKRIKISDERNHISITIDVHKLKCYQARRLINNIINLARISSELIIIHGFNQGTAIREMISSDFSNKHIEKIYIDHINKGVSHILITA